MKGSTKFGPAGGCSSETLASTGLPAERRASLAKYVNLGLAQKTWSTYRTAERMWRKCEADTGTRLELPWRQEQTLFFLDWLISDRKVTSATASSYLAGMKKVHEIRGLDEPQLRKTLVNQILKGKKNLETVEKRRKSDVGRLPVTLTILKIIKEAIRAWDKDMEYKLLVWSVCTLAFHGSFRIHELLCRNEVTYDPDFCLLEKDVQLKLHSWNDGTKGKVLHVAVKGPKESKHGRTVIVDVYETGGPTCPVKAFCRWKPVLNNDNRGVLFAGTDMVPMTGRKFNAILKELLSPHIDYSKGQITAHSFRSGVPSLLGSLGFTDLDIKTVGRWSSRAFEHYTKLPRTTRAAIAQKLGKL